MMSVNNFVVEFWLHLSMIQAWLDSAFGSHKPCLLSVKD